jgi:hypothetical protein
MGKILSPEGFKLTEVLVAWFTDVRLMPKMFPTKKTTPKF